MRFLCFFCLSWTRGHSERRRTLRSVAQEGRRKGPPSLHRELKILLLVMPLDSFSFPQRGATSEDSWSDCGSDLTSEASSWVISQHPSRPPSHASTGVANLADLDDFEDTELHPRSSGAVDAASSGAADDGHSSVDNDNNSVASTVRCVFFSPLRSSADVGLAV